MGITIVSGLLSYKTRWILGPLFNEQPKEGYTDPIKEFDDKYEKIDSFDSLLDHLMVDEL